MVSIPFWMNQIREMYVGMAWPPRYLGRCASLAADTCAVWPLGKRRVRNSQGKTQSQKPGMRDSRAGTGDTSCRSLPAIGTDERRRSGGPTVAPSAREVKHGHFHGPSRTASESSVARVNQDLRDVCEKNVLTNGRSALLPHRGHATLALLCSLIERVTRTSRLHLSQ